MADYDEDMMETVKPEEFAANFFAPSVSAATLDFGAATHIGKIRSRNEDHYAIVKRSRSQQTLLSSLPADYLSFADDHAHVLMVADGMGGAVFGEFASRLAIQTILDFSNRATSWVMKFTDFDNQQIQQRVEAYVQQVQLALREYSQSDPTSSGMGTTWTCAYLAPPHAIIAHIGDSRAYLHRGNALHRITRDETMAQQYIDAGLSPDSVKNLGHILTNSFCAHFESVSAQIHLVELESGDRLLVCSDGLTDMVLEERIELELRQHSRAQTVCDALVAQALKNGGKDNVTVLVADIRVADNPSTRNRSVKIKSYP